jgi:hypothetical protein
VVLEEVGWLVVGVVADEVNPVNRERPHHLVAVGLACESGLWLLAGDAIRDALQVKSARSTLAPGMTRTNV